MERSVERATQAKTGRIGVKKRDLVPKYSTPEKVDKLVQKLKDKGLWSWDEDWPNDEEDWTLKIHNGTLLDRDIPGLFL